MVMRMGNLVDYARDYGDRIFWSHPFSDVDSLALATLSYMNLEVTPFAKIPNFNCTIAELDKLAHANDLSRYMWSKIRGADLLGLMARSLRFGDILIHDYERHIDGDEQKQFTAVTFTFNTDQGYIDYIAFQGTDDTLAGWKEDMNMTFARDVPAQREALRYVAIVASQSDNKLILGGHSKGGNLAVYSGVKSSRDIQDRIVAIYDHDGPGFLDGVIDDVAPSLRRRIHKTMPRNAFFGMLLDDRIDGDFKIVRSDSVSIFQHDALSWQILNGQFVECAEASGSSRFYVRTFSEWLAKLTPEKRRQFFDALYDIIAQSRDTTEQGVKKYLAINMPKIISQVRSSDPEVRELIVSTLKLLASTSLTEARRAVVNRFVSPKNNH